MLFCGLPAGLFSRDFHISVLPFLIQGKPQLAGFDIQKTPWQLREAAGFLIQQDRDIALWNPSNFENLLRQSNYNLKKPFQKENLVKVCTLSDSMYILGGIAFFSRRAIEFQIKTYSCRLNQFLGESTIKKTYHDFQQALRRSILQSTPFINPVRKANISNMEKRNSKIDLAIILDTSGSMVADFPVIISSLKSLQSSLPKGSRIGVILMKEDSRQIILPFTQDWPSTIRTLAQTRPVGQTDRQGFLEALTIVERYNKWQAAKNLYIFTDLHFANRRESYVESALRRITQNGIRTHIFPMTAQNYTDRREWTRISRSVKTFNPNVIYGRKIYPIGQRPYFIVSLQGKYYTGRYGDDLGSRIKSGNLTTENLLPIPTTSFSRTELNLESLSTAYPAMMKQKISSYDPIISNLGKSISNSLDLKKGTGSYQYKILVKNKTNSFWLPVRHPGVIKKIRQQQNKEFFIGLHIKKTPTTRQVVTFPHPIYIREYSNVPRLFITSWQHLHKLSLDRINPEDVWFMKVKLLEINSN